MNEIYELLKGTSVQAKSLEDFMNKYYKHDKFRGRGEAYANTLIQSHRQDFELYGIDWISHHDSVTGKTVSFVG